MAEDPLLDRSGDVIPLPIRNITRSSFLSKPIQSYGFIVRALDTQRWLLIRRMYMVEFQLLMRGSFRRGNLPSLIRCLCQEEREELEACCPSGIPDLKFIRKVIERMFPSVETKDKEYAVIRLQEAAPDIPFLLRSIEASGRREWLWPKGQQRPREDKTQCADREFNEEVGQIMPKPVKHASFQLHDKIVTTTGRQFESTYWVRLIPHEFTLTPPGNREVEIGERRWVSSEEALSLLSEARSKIFLQAKEWADSQKDIVG